MCQMIGAHTDGIQNLQNARACAVGIIIAFDPDQSKQPGYAEKQLSKILCHACNFTCKHVPGDVSQRGVNRPYLFKPYAFLYGFTDGLPYGANNAAIYAIDVP